MPTLVRPHTILTRETAVPAVLDAMANPKTDNRYLVRLDNGTYHLVGRWDAEMSLRPYAHVPDGIGLDELGNTAEDRAEWTVQDADELHAKFEGWSQDARDEEIRRTMRWIADLSRKELADLRGNDGTSLHEGY